MPKHTYEQLKTVDELIAELNSIKQEHGNIPVGVIGHFGEVYPFTFNDGYCHSHGTYQTPRNVGWRSDARKEIPVIFSVSVIDLGEEPD